MKFKIEIDLNEIINELFEDFNPEYDTIDLDIKSEVKKDIIFQTKREVLKEVKEPLKLEMQNRVKILVTDAFKDEVNNSVKEFVKNGKIKGRYSNDPDLSVQEWIAKEFQDTSRYNTLSDLVKKKSEKLAKEIRDRYDHLFASQLITKMNEQGLLKDGVFNALMQDNKTGK